MGELHGIYLMVAWFYTLQERVIEPALTAGQLVIIIDSWIDKFLARVRTHQLLKGWAMCSTCLQVV
jgi:hypothetical protein